MKIIDMESAVVRQLVLLISFLVLIGCNQSDLIQKFASSEDQAFAKHCIDLLRDHQFDEIEKVTDPSSRPPDLHVQMLKLADLFPVGEPTSIKLVGANQFVSAQRKLIGNDPNAAGYSSGVTLTYEYEYPDNSRLIRISLLKQGEHTSITELRIQRESMPLEAQNRFHVGLDTQIHFLLILLLACFLPLLTVFALVSCIRTKMRGKKWLWILFILFGLGSMTLNWTTGLMTFNPFYIQLFSAGAFAQLYGPWMISISLPVGAVTFLMMKSRLSIQDMNQNLTLDDK
jgi:hypothetical protein